MTEETRIHVRNCSSVDFSLYYRKNINVISNTGTRQILSQVKAHVPVTVQHLIDRCMQAFGAMGLCQDTPLFAGFSGARWLRIADGPDAVHQRTAARIELRRQRRSPLMKIGTYPVDRTRVFRRSTDPISSDAKRRIQEYSRL